MADEGEKNFKNYNPWYPPTFWMDFTKFDIFEKHDTEKNNDHYLDVYLVSMYHSVLFIG
jgi:hypothetical protein